MRQTVIHDILAIFQLSQRLCEIFPRLGDLSIVFVRNICTTGTRGCVQFVLS